MYLKELKTTLLSLQSIESSNLIIGGDWNIILTHLDRYSTQNPNQDPSLK